MTESKWRKAVEDKLIGKEITEVSFMSKAQADSWGWYKRPIILGLSDGNQLIISQDDEGNNGGSIFTSYDDLPVIPVL